MFIIAICFLLFLWLLWCIAMFFQHIQDLSKWNARPEEEKGPLGKYPKPEWSDTFEAMRLGGGLIFFGALAIVGWIFF